MRRLAVACGCALLLVPAARAGTPTRPVYDSQGHIVATPFAPPPASPRLTKQRATALLLGVPKVRRWLRHYPRRTWITDATYSAQYANWTVKVWSGKAGEVATGKIDDASGAVTEAWTGPQVAWKMARGYKGAFGGKEINSAAVWPLSGRGAAEAVRPRGHRRRDPQPHPDERPLRVGEPAGRHLRPRRLRGLPPGLLDPRVERQVGQAAGCAPDRDPVRPARGRRARACRPPFRRYTARCDAGVRVGGLAVHAVRVELEHERRDHARAADLGLLARQLTRGARRLRRARRLDEVRGSAARAALGLVSGVAAEPAPGGLPRRVRARDA